jgi:nitroimidazol reductase NimA-like FMN-containing flavoprotein (pyridoxamine 5'-phosphate oxidase superfamily)
VTVQEIVAANRYMTLATADADGTPWATPVWFATADCRRFYWISKPGARHSRNIAARPEIGIVIYDSTVTPGDAKAVYVEATAERSDELDVYNAEEARQGLTPLTPADVAEGARHRMYRATATAVYTLDERDERIPQAP